MTYNVDWARAANKSLKSLSPNNRDRVLEAVKELKENPRGPNVKPLHGSDENLWRRRVGDIRIVFTIEDTELRILIVRVANRREVYR